MVSFGSLRNKCLLIELNCQGMSWGHNWFLYSNASLHSQTQSLSFIIIILMSCIGQGSPEKPNEWDTHIQIHKRRFITGICSRDYGGWEVPRSMSSKLETQESWWCVFQFKGRRPMLQLNQVPPYSASFFCSGLQLMQRSPTVLGRVICFTAACWFRC